jgi:hypothetical protein
MKFTLKKYGDPFVNDFIAEMEGIKSISLPTAWTRGKEKYAYICGAIRMPTFSTPGYLLTVGVEYDTEGKTHCIDEFQSDDETAILDRAKEIQKEYGKGVIDTWLGDASRLMSLSTDAQVSPPIDYDQADAFQIYLIRLKTALSENNKTLQLNGCDILRNSILSFVREKAAKPDEHPAVWCAGAIVHTLCIIRPWTRAVDRIDLVPTRGAEQQAYMDKEHEKELVRQVYGGEQWKW